MAGVPFSAEAREENHSTLWVVGSKPPKIFTTCVLKSKICSPSLLSSHSAKGVAFSLGIGVLSTLKVSGVVSKQPIALNTRAKTICSKGSLLIYIAASSS